MDYKNTVKLHTILTVLTLVILLLPLSQGDFFGSEGDWYSQHVGAAENLRQTMLNTGSLFPQFSTGGVDATSTIWHITGCCGQTCCFPVWCRI